MKKGKAHTLGVPGGGVFASNVESATPHQANAHALDRWLAKLLLKAIGSPRVELKLWNGERVSVTDVTKARVEIADRHTLRSLLYSPSVAFGDGYAVGKIEVSGDLVAFLEEVYRGQWRMRARIPRFMPRFTHTFGNTRVKARENIHHHYDLGNEFYRLWLDEQMVYTCAYYESAQATLEEAQTAKLEHVCRKLRLDSGQTVVEAGCGWGALAMHMAEQYGVRVKAFNISREQLVYAREKARERGLQHRVEFIEDDYRNIDLKCDAFVSVGMLEHVGVERFQALGEVIARCLRTRGTGLIHSIGRASPSPNNRWIEKRIFPGSYPPSLAQISRIFEPFEFSVLDVENLRLHYRETCRAWLKRFDAVADEVAEMYDENFVRAWRLYLAGSTAAFEVGTLQLYQIVFAPFGNNDVPWTRHHLYSSGERRA